jgi:hypothetical protein
MSRWHVTMAGPTGERIPTITVRAEGQVSAVRAAIEVAQQWKYRPSTLVRINDVGPACWNCLR